MALPNFPQKISPPRNSPDRQLVSRPKAPPPPQRPPQPHPAPEANAQNTRGTRDRLASRALPDLKRFIAEGVPHPEIALIILNTKSTTTRLQKIFTEELQNYPGNLQRAFTNTLIRASRTDPAVAAVMALAV